MDKRYGVCTKIMANKYVFVLFCFCFLFSLNQIITSIFAT